MQLHIARLCLDCDEVHDSQQCPVCTSEAFTFLSRWVPAPERRMRPRQSTSSTAEVYRELTSPASPKRRKRLLTPRNVGIAAVAVAGWLLRRANNQKEAR